MTGTGPPEERAELIWAHGIHDDEAAALMRAVVETADLHSFDNNSPPDQQSARRVTTIICDRNHAHRDSRPELAFVYATSEGLLYEARIVPRFDGGQAADDPPRRGGPAPLDEQVRILDVQQHAVLLDRTCPDALPIQCRTHGASTISADQLREVIAASSAERLPVPTSLLVSRFRPT
jgi:hypothetical protein